MSRRRVIHAAAKAVRALLRAAVIALVAAAAASAAPRGDFTVTSTLQGRTTLPIRLPWIAHPSLPPSQVREVDFFIDGKLRWVERRIPYSYGDDGERLVTRFLAAGEHTFVVVAQAKSGGAARETVHATIPSAPAPPAAIAGKWRRDVDTSSLRLPPGVEQPSGTYTMVIERRWIQMRFPGRFVPGSAAGASVNSGHGWIIDSDWIATGTTLTLPGAVNFHRVTDNVAEGGFWCGPGRPAATYGWRLEGDTLTLSAGKDGCAPRKLVWGGAWTRVS